LPVWVSAGIFNLTLPLRVGTSNSPPRQAVGPRQANYSDYAEKELSPYAVVQWAI
jgi:hypothetical protein